jgi:hypothetical protein
MSEEKPVRLHVKPMRRVFGAATAAGSRQKQKRTTTTKAKPPHFNTLFLLILSSFNVFSCFLSTIAQTEPSVHSGPSVHIDGLTGNLF